MKTENHVPAKESVIRTYLNDIFFSKPEPLVAIDRNGIVEMANKAALDLLGRSGSECVGKPLKNLIEDEPANLDGYLSTKKMPVSSRIRKLLTKNGQENSTVLLVSLALTDDDGRACGALYLLRDARDIRNDPEALEKARVELETRADERKAELVTIEEILSREIAERNRAAKDLEDVRRKLDSTQTQLLHSSKLASVGELSAALVHELNQPLMVIRATVQQVVRKARAGKKCDPAEFVEHLERIERNTGRMMTVIDGLRSFSRRPESSWTKVDMNDVVGNVALMLRDLLGRRKIRVIAKLSENLPKIMGDIGMMEQVIMNLLSNAADAIENKRKTSNTGGENIRLAEGLIEIVTQRSGKDPGLIEILIRDNGGGIAPEDQERIFEPFFTTKGPGKGTGLGLSISSEIVGDHLGVIDAPDSGPGGTTFRIRLPVSPPKRAAPVHEKR